MTDRPSYAGTSPGDIARELAVIHQLCVCHLGELREESDRKVEHCCVYLYICVCVHARTQSGMCEYHVDISVHVTLRFIPSTDKI